MQIVITALILVAVLSLVIGAIFYFFYSRKLKKRQSLRSTFQKKLFLVTLPKEAAKNAQSNKEYNPELIKKIIATGENFFTSIGGLKAQKGMKSHIHGRTDHFSFEIVCKDGQISFYVSVPSELSEYVSQMILAQYPEASVDEETDYNIFHLNSTILGCHLVQTREFIFPMKTYQQIDGDPLDAITNSLSKVFPGDSAVIQFVVRSANKKWHRWGTQVAQEMQKGKKLMDAVKSTSPHFTITKFFSFFSTTTDAKKKKNQPEQPRMLTPMEQEVIKALEHKTSKAGLDVNIRIIVSSALETNAQRYLHNIIEAFNQFHFYQYGNGLKKYIINMDMLIDDFIYRKFREKYKMILNTEEMASLIHFPTPFTETPNIRWLLARKTPVPNNTPTAGLLLGENIYRGVRKNVYIKDDDRRRHMYAIGMTGTGKSTFLENLAIQDIRNGKGVCVIDPHGTLIENILPAVPKERIEDVIIFDPSDVERPMGLNILEADTLQQQDIAVQEMIAIFYKLVTDPSMIGPMFEHNMRNAMLTLMADKENPGTITDIPRIFTDEKFQKYKVSKVEDPMVRSYWEKEMSKTSDFHKSEMLGYLISKVGRFVENAMIRNIIGQPKSSFDLRKIMDEKKVLLVNLSKGKVGEINSNLLGLIIVSKLQMAALGRADMPEAQRNDFYLYIDEFQNFITDSISTILAEARKYRLNLIVTHQYLGQLSGGGVEGKEDKDSKMKDAIFGNVGTMVSFRVGVDDAEVMARQFAPTVAEYDVMNIEKYNAYIRLLIDNQASKTFSMHCFPPITGDSRISEIIKEHSRLVYGRERLSVEREILKTMQLGYEASIKS